ncbi:MAG: HTTM domain-containing protein [Pirellulales bacterium]
MSRPALPRERAADQFFSGRLRALQNNLSAPVDISFLVFFRIIFSAAILWTAADLLSNDTIPADYIRPLFRFSYHCFSWVKPWPGSGMYVHVAGLGVLAICVGVGFLYRLSATLLFLGFTYIFLLEKALYLNHYYLMCLLSFVMIILPAHRRLSIDSFLRPSLRTDFVAAWTMWLLRFHIALPYFFGGIAKLKADWLRGQPMLSWLSIAPLRFLVGPWVEQPWVAVALSWGGVVFDLSIVPLLLWRRTQKVAFCFAVAFHLANAFLFNIGVFPWLMIAATLVFFPPDWPRRLLRLKPPVAILMLAPSRSLPTGQRFLRAALLIYLLCHLLIPFRHLLYPGNVLWTEEGHTFAWNMMLRTKVTGIQVIVAKTKSRSVEYVDVMRWLTARQFEEMTHDPEMMREFAHFVRKQYREAGKGDVEVHVVALCSLNGRKPQLLLDPTVDLASQPRTFRHKPWIVPLAEPFRRDPWNVPLAEWQKHVDLLPPTTE